MKFIDRPVLDALLSAPHAHGQDPVLIDVANDENEVTLSCAHRVDFNRIVSNRDDTAGLLPQIDTLNAALAHTGIAPERPVVLFDAQNGLGASRLGWTLALCGINKIFLLNGGRAALADLVGQTPPPQTESATTLVYDLSRHHACAEDIAAQLNHWMIVDARSADEYQGIDRRSKHAGHIPGARHFDWTRCLDPERPGHLLPDTRLLDRLAEQGIVLNDRNAPIVVYCQSHRRSSLLYCVLKHLGFEDVRGYPGAWSDWGNRDDVPITDPQGETEGQPR